MLFWTTAVTMKIKSDAFLLKIFCLLQQSIKLVNWFCKRRGCPIALYRLISKRSVMTDVNDCVCHNWRIHLQLHQIWDQLPEGVLWKNCYEDLTKFTVKHIRWSPLLSYYKRISSQFEHFSVLLLHEICRYFCWDSIILCYVSPLIVLIFWLYYLERYYEGPCGSVPKNMCL